jgi:hypothetical protein
MGDMNGHVCGLLTVNVEWVKDDTGRMQLKEIEGECDVHDQHK